MDLYSVAPRLPIGNKVVALSARHGESLRVFKLVLHARVALDTYKGI